MIYLWITVILFLMVTSNSVSRAHNDRQRHTANKYYSLSIQSGWLSARKTFLSSRSIQTLAHNLVQLLSLIVCWVSVAPPIECISWVPSANQNYAAITLGNPILLLLHFPRIYPIFSNSDFTFVKNIYISTIYQSFKSIGPLFTLRTSQNRCVTTVVTRRIERVNTNLMFWITYFLYL